MAARNDTFRKWLGDTHPRSMLLEGHEFDGGILGVTDSGRVVYGYDEIVDSLSEYYINQGSASDLEDARQMAVDWVESNTIRSLPYAGPMSPIVVVFDPDREVMFDSLDTSDEPEEFVFNMNCPGVSVKEA